MQIHSFICRTKAGESPSVGTGTICRLVTPASLNAAMRSLT